jgi:nitrite reductase/ring-hydroxylating ferredoxin subunit
MSTSSRRGGQALLRTVIGAAVLVMAAVVALIVSLEVESASLGPGWVRAASVSEIAERGVLYVGEARAYVVTTRPGSPIALYARSPHLGGPVRYCESSGWFEDRLHGAKFDGLGRYALGPAPRGLDRFEVRFVDGDVWVNTSNLFLGPPRGQATTPPSGPFCVRE